MKFPFTIATLLWAITSMGQTPTPTVRAYLSPDSILIGDRFEYVIEVEKDQVQTIVFPELGNATMGLELVESPPVDTLERRGRIQKLRKRYTLAAFEEGVFNMGHAKVLYADKNISDTLRSSDSLLLQVATFQIDSTSQSIYDIKAQKNLPFRFGEISGYVKWAVAGVFVLLLLLYAVRRLLARNGRSLSSIFKPSPPLPPHVAAIKALEALHHQKLWQNNRHKQYYSALTDILRTYIAARYGFGAMEMTSDEIIAAMRHIEDIPQKSAMDLVSILHAADLVKFAKAMPDAEQNESDYLKAYYFVEETKQPEADEQADTESEMQN